MIRKVEYQETDNNTQQIASDAFYHLLMKTASEELIASADKFYTNNLITSDIRYSGFKNKIIKVK